jgi:hypothetical protein
MLEARNIAESAKDHRPAMADFGWRDNNRKDLGENVLNRHGV